MMLTTAPIPKCPGCYLSLVRSSAWLRTRNPVGKRLEIVRPEYGEPAILCIQKIVELIHATQHSCRDNLPQAKIQLPACGLHRRIIVQPLHGIRRRVRYLAFDRHDSVIPQRDDDVPFSRSESALATKLPRRRRMRNIRDHSVAQLLDVDSTLFVLLTEAIRPLKNALGERLFRMSVQNSDCDNCLR